MRELAYIQTIKSLSPIPGADAIEKAEVLGWELVVKKGDFKVGDLCVYCEVDAILPDLPCFEFLRSKKFRIRTVKIRGQISQGIAFPLSIIKQVEPSFPILSVKVGDDLTKVLQITKYDPEAELDLPQAKKSWIANKISFLKWKVLGIREHKRADDFPTHLVPKTDETRVQKMGSELSERVGESAYITEKCEGTSATFIYRNSGNWFTKLFGNRGIFQICSRNKIVYTSGKQAPVHMLVDVSVKYDLCQKLSALGRNLAIQGECIGPKVQGNIYNLPSNQLKIFLMYDLDKKKYLLYDEMVSLCQTLGLEMVPVVDDNATIQNDVKYYVELSKGKSKINPNVLREGIVIRSKINNFSFKSINPEYLLKQT